MPDELPPHGQIPDYYFTGGSRITSGELSRLLNRLYNDLVAAGGAHSGTHEDGGPDELNVTGLSGELADPQKIAVRKNDGAVIGSRAQINLKEGPGIVLAVIDDGGDGEIEITVENAQAGGVGIATTRSWTFQTNEAVQYVGGFYDFSGTDNDFSPSVNFGDPNYGKAAHVLFVLGGATVDELTIRVTGTSITDGGVQTPADTEDIVIPSATPLNSYFETSKKFNGQVTISVVSGTPVTMNYGWAKYHDFANQNFKVTGLECVWESDSTDSGSDIQLIHHKATGWTFNVGADPTPPALAARSIDHAGNDTHAVGPGAWKRTNLDQLVNGADSEGILFCIASGSTGLGSLSFRLLTCEVSLELV